MDKGQKFKLQRLGGAPKTGYGGGGGADHRNLKMSTFAVRHMAFKHYTVGEG